MEINLSPSKDILDEIEKWLITERDNSNTGFYCNWNQIRGYFNKGDFAAILIDGSPVGFATWRTVSDVTGQIVIVEIKPEYRRNGYAQQLMERVFSHLQSLGLLVVDLQCEPIESEKFWRKLGFKDVPNNIHFWSNLGRCLFKPLVTTQPLSDVEGASEYIELWDNEPYITQNRPAKWRWKVETEISSHHLKKPIIHPCEKNWRIRLVRNGHAIVDDKVKRFGGIEIDFDPYLVIRRLPD